MRALAILLLVPGFSLGLVAGLTNLVSAPTPVSAAATDLVWSDRVFTTRADFAAWLARRGTSYELWSKRHPAAARHFEVPSRRPLASQASGQHEAAGGSAAPRARSTKALLIASISLALLVAMLALSRVVRSARFLLVLPSMGRRVRSPEPLGAVLMAGPSKPRERARAPAKPRSPLLEGAANLHWRWSLSQVGGLRQSMGRRLRSLEPPAAINMTMPSRPQRRAGAPSRSHTGAKRGSGLLRRITADWTAEAPTFNSRVVRRYLSRVTYCAVVLGLSFAIGASVAIYFK